MRSLGKGVMSATTQVKVLSPEIFLIALGQGFHVLEASIGIARFYKLTIKMVRKWLNRRSQKRKMSWAKFTEYLAHYPLPPGSAMYWY